MHGQSNCIHVKELVPLLVGISSLYKWHDPHLNYTTTKGYKAIVKKYAAEHGMGQVPLEGFRRI